MKLWLPYTAAPQVELIGPIMAKIVVSWRVYQDTHHLIRECGRHELSWIGKVEERREGRLTIYYLSTIRLLPQNVSHIHTRLDPLAVAQAAHEWIMEKGGNDNPCKFWGHTHPGASTEPSHRDNQQMLEMIQGKFTPSFFIRGIFSQGQAHYHGEFTLYDYVRGISIRHVPWEVEDIARQQKWARRIAKCVTTNRQQCSH